MADFLLPWDVIREVPSSEYSSRDGATPSMHVWHHGATTSGAAIEANMEPGGRELSATGVIWNDGTSVGKVPEWARAWTSGSYRIDRMAITTEMANGAIDGWTITDATYEAAGLIAAAEYLQYGIPLDRDHHVGHNELYSAKWGWESYSTYCPGDPARVDWIVELGRRFVSSGLAGLGRTPITPTAPAPIWKTQEKESNTMFLVKINDGEARYGGGTMYALTDGKSRWIEFRTEEAANTLAVRFGNAANVTYDEWDAFKAAATSEPVEA